MSANTSIPNITCNSNTQDLINHIVFVIDASGSMSSLTDSVIGVFDAQVNYLSVRSQELKQETRVSVYLFESSVQCIIYDKDVMRLPSLKDKYKPGGGTALLDGTSKALDDLEKTQVLYGDHAFLVYVITDGEENASRTKTGDMSKRLASLPANWTLAVLVPNQQGVFEAKKFGFSPNNIQIWDTNKDGILKAGDNIRTATDAFLTNRAQGVRGTSNLFNIDMGNVTADVVKGTLQEIDAATYKIIPATADASIKDFVQTHTGNAFTKGAACYQLTKKELIQEYKKIFIQDKNNNKVYGGNHARDLLKLPHNVDVDVKPASYGDFNIFVESTSTNRKILANTSVLILC